MSQITREQVEHVALLARLELTEEEEQRMAAQLSEILTYIDKLNELDTSRTEPMAQVLAETHPEAALRDDRNRGSLPHEKAVDAAPDHSDPYLKVPKVIDR